MTTRTRRSRAKRRRRRRARQRTRRNAEHGISTLDLPIDVLGEERMLAVMTAIVKRVLQQQT
jgi:hypothetical protein